MKTVPLIVTDTVNNSYQCYKVMADEDMTEVDVIAAIKKSNSAKRKQVNYSAINNRACKLGKS